MLNNVFNALKSTSFQACQTFSHRCSHIPGVFIPSQQKKLLFN